MADKKTTSDRLKEVFAQYGGGSEKDWKRLSKKNNPEGQPVRVFENKNTGVRLEVVELGEGRFKARKLTDTFGQTQPAAAAQSSTPSIYAGDIKTAVDFFMTCLETGKWEADMHPTPDAYGNRIKQMGKELAARFVFAVLDDPEEQDDGGFSVQICPDFARKDGWRFSNHIGIDDLMPKASCDMEGQFSFRDEDYNPIYKNPNALVDMMLAQGFKWDASFQQMYDKQQLSDGKRPCGHILKIAQAQKTDPSMEQAADQVMAQVESGIIPPRALIDHAGRALAGRFAFTIGEDDGLYVEISPRDFDYDQHVGALIGHLLPKGCGENDEVTELTFVFGGYDDAASLRADLIACGFVPSGGDAEPAFSSRPPTKGSPRR